jgi:hypothetical protein
MLLGMGMLLLGSAGAHSASILCSGNNGHGVEVNNVWCNTIINWNNSHQTVCVAEQYNSQTQVISFDVSPPNGGKSTATMAPFQFNRIFAWLDGTPTSSVR